MQWLKSILEKATIDEGELDVKSVLESVKLEIPKHFVAKADYNAKAEELKTANTTIDTLKKDNEGNVDLQTAIATHETTIENLKKENEDIRRSHALKSVLTESGCTDPEYLIFKHGGIDKFTFDKSGNPLDGKNVADSYKESLPHIFPTGQKQQRYTPPGGNGGAGVLNPFLKDTWNLTEQGKLLKENPAEAKSMAAVAGINL